MTRSERVLYHQIHPLKLFTDISVAFLAVYLLWRRRLWTSLVVQVVPPAAVSAALIQWADLDLQRQSALGQYIKRHMTPSMQALRLAGWVVMALGAWNRRPWLIVAGVALVLSGWLRGRLLG